MCCPANHMLIYVCVKVVQEPAKSGSGTFSTGDGKTMRDVPTALPWHGWLLWMIATAPLPRC